MNWTCSHSLPKCYNLPKKNIWPYIEHPTSQPLLCFMTTPPTNHWTAILTPRWLSPATFTIRGNTWDAEHCHCHNPPPCDQWDNSDEENIWTYSLINNKMYDIGERSKYWFHKHKTYKNITVQTTTDTLYTAVWCCTHNRLINTVKWTCVKSTFWMLLSVVPFHYMVNC